MTDFNQLKQDLNSVSEFLVTLGDEKIQEMDRGDGCKDLRMY